jgi:hypothetical protein
VVSHRYRWIDCCAAPEEVERDHIQRAVNILTVLTGERPLGWITGRPGPHTRRLIVEAGFSSSAIRSLMNYPAAPRRQGASRPPLFA